MKKMLRHGRNSKLSSGGEGDVAIEYVSYKDYTYLGGIPMLTHVTDTLADETVSDSMYGQGDPFSITIAGDITANDLANCYLTIWSGSDSVSYIDGQAIKRGTASFNIINIFNQTGVDYYEDYNKNVFLLDFGNIFISSEAGSIPSLACSLYNNAGQALLDFDLSLSVDSPRRYFEKISIGSEHYSEAQSMTGPITISTSALVGETIYTSIYGYWSEAVAAPTAKVISSDNSSMSVGSYIPYNYSGEETDCVRYEADLPIGSSPCTFTLEFNNDSYCRVTFNVALG